MSMGATTSYGGKPGGTLTVKAGDGWVMLDADTADPTKSGLEIQETYLHCDCEWKAPDSAVWNLLANSFLAPVLEKIRFVFTPAGRIRVCYERESSKDGRTGYQDFTVASLQEDFLITHNHSERGEAYQGGRWFVKIGGGLAKIVITTRYSKTGTAY